MAGGTPLRPVPSDFAQIAPTMHVVELRRHYDAGSSTVQRWLSEAGVQSKGPPTQRNRPMPDDFAAVVPTMTRDELTKHYRVCKKKLGKWLDMSGAIPAKRYSNRRPIPADFAEQARQLTKTGLQKLYGTSFAVLDRWIGECGVQPAPRVYECQVRPKVTVWRMPGRAKVQPTRAYSIHELAADVLRRYGPVYRCDERGRPKEKGQFWRIGNIVVDDDELLARADRKRQKCA